MLTYLSYLIRCHGTVMFQTITPLLKTRLDRLQVQDSPKIEVRKSWTRLPRDCSCPIGELHWQPASRDEDHFSTSHFFWKVLLFSPITYCAPSELALQHFDYQSPISRVFTDLLRAKFATRYWSPCKAVRTRHQIQFRKCAWSTPQRLSFMISWEIILNVMLFFRIAGMTTK